MSHSAVRLQLQTKKCRCNAFLRARFTSRFEKLAVSPALNVAVHSKERVIDAAFGPVDGVAEAEARVRRLALGHYENFSVVSRFVPRAVRQDYFNLYAFCRTADDLGDEMQDRAASLRYLADLRVALRTMYAGRPAGAVFTALASTVERHAIPIEPFLDLISAFEQDQHVTRYDTFDRLLDYCRRSANPVGRLVLYVLGHRDAERQRLSDYTCTALQLTNFWQDIRRDLRRLDRIYLPADTMEEFGVSASDLNGGPPGVPFRTMMRQLVDRTEALFARGDALLATLSRREAAQIGLFSQGGRAILASVRRQNYDTLSRRPTVSRWKKAALVAQAIGTHAVTRFGRRNRV